MVTIQSFTKRTSKEGKEFITLDLVSGVELVQSQTTGKFFATIRRCSIPATFDENVAATMVGSSLPGEIVRIECLAYDYTVKETGEIIKLAHSYAYQPHESAIIQQVPARSAHVPAGLL